MSFWRQPRSVASWRTTRIPPTSFAKTSRSRRMLSTPATAAGVKRLLFLGSSCIYPKACPQPMKEEYLLTGPLEPTNRALRSCQRLPASRCAGRITVNTAPGISLPCPRIFTGPAIISICKNSHVLPALIRKVIEAKARGERRIIVWGTGTPRRELLYSEDLGEACVFLLNLSEDAIRGVVERR